MDGADNFGCAPQAAPETIRSTQCAPRSKWPPAPRGSPRSGCESATKPLASRSRSRSKRCRWCSGMSASRQRSKSFPDCSLRSKLRGLGCMLCKFLPLSRGLFWDFGPGNIRCEPSGFLRRVRLARGVTCFLLVPAFHPGRKRKS